MALWRYKSQRKSRGWVAGGTQSPSWATFRSRTSPHLAASPARHPVCLDAITVRASPTNHPPSISRSPSSTTVRFDGALFSASRSRILSFLKHHRHRRPLRSHAYNIHMSSCITTGAAVSYPSISSDTMTFSGSPSLCIAIGGEAYRWTGRSRLPHTAADKLHLHSNRWRLTYSETLPSQSLPALLVSTIASRPVLSQDLFLVRDAI